MSSHLPVMYTIGAYSSVLNPDAAVFSPRTVASPLNPMAMEFIPSSPCCCSSDVVSASTPEPSRKRKASCSTIAPEMSIPKRTKICNSSPTSSSTAAKSRTDQSGEFVLIRDDISQFHLSDARIDIYEDGFYVSGPLWKVLHDFKGLKAKTFLSYVWLGIIPPHHPWIPENNGHVNVKVVDFRSSRTEVMELLPSHEWGRANFEQWHAAASTSPKPFCNTNAEVNGESFSLFECVSSDRLFLEEIPPSLRVQIVDSGIIVEGSRFFPSNSDFVYEFLSRIEQGVIPDAIFMFSLDKVAYCREDKKIAVELTDYRNWEIESKVVHLESPLSVKLDLSRKRKLETFDTPIPKRQKSDSDQKTQSRVKSLPVVPQEKGNTKKRRQQASNSPDAKRQKSAATHYENRLKENVPWLDDSNKAASQKAKSGKRKDTSFQQRFIQELPVADKRSYQTEELFARFTESSGMSLDAFEDALGKFVVDVDERDSY
jgi:hypothetical protein